VVQDRVTSPVEREVVGSIPTWIERSSSSMDRAPNVPFPSSTFGGSETNSERKMKNENEQGDDGIHLASDRTRGTGATLHAVSTFRLRQAVLERKEPWAVI
jgi:hypothetical protein